MLTKLKKKISLLSLIFCLLICTKAIAVNDFITIGTGNITGIYYPTGGAICRILNKMRSSYDIRCSVEATMGSLYNIQALNTKQIDLAIVQSDLQYQAFNGVNHFSEKGPNKSLRALFSLHEDAFTVIVKANSNIKKFEDIRGKRINIGSIGSGSRAVMEELMRLYNWVPNDFKDNNEIKASDQPEALCNNKIDVMLYSVGHPNGAVQEATSTCETIIIPIDGSEVKQLIKQHPYYVDTIIKGGTYPGNPHDIHALGVKSTVIVLESMSEKVAYNITKAIFENFESFKKLHPVFNQLDYKKLIKDGNTIPLHKGAERYFREKNLLNEY